MQETGEGRSCQRSGGGNERKKRVGEGKVADSGG